MSLVAKKKFHRFNAVLQNQDGKYISGSDKTEFDFLLDLSTITAVQPQSIFSSVVPGGHTLGSRLYSFAVQGVPYVVVKETLAEVELLLRSV